MARIGYPEVPEGMTIAERKVFLREAYPHKVVIPQTRWESTRQYIDWCAEHCSGKWHNFNGSSGYHFASLADATLFKMKWL